MRRQYDPDLDGRDSWAQTDAILPDQFHSAATALSDSERRLRLAVLEDAIRQMQRYAGATRGRAGALYEEACAWFASDDRAEPFSFENVCEALGLDADWLRAGLERWQVARPAADAPARPLPRFSSRRVQPRPRVDRRRAA